MAEVAHQDGSYNPRAALNRVRARIRTNASDAGNKRYGFEAKKESHRDKCRTLQGFHKIVVGRTWGSAPADSQALWSSLSCDQFVT